jgi:hypothetical protein
MAGEGLMADSISGLLPQGLLVNDVDRERS